MGHVVLLDLRLIILAVKNKINIFGRLYLFDLVFYIGYFTEKMAVQQQGTIPQ